MLQISYRPRNWITLQILKWFLDAANDDIVEAIELQFAMEDIQNAVNNSPVNATNGFKLPNLQIRDESSLSGITLNQLLLQIASSQSEF